MAERKRRTQQERPKRTQTRKPKQGFASENGTARKNMERDQQAFAELDAAINNVINRRQSAAGQSVVADGQQPQRVKISLSDDEKVQGFVQHPGE